MVYTSTEHERYSFPFFAHFDKTCDVYSSSKCNWYNSYHHITQSHYRIVKYLYNNVENPLTCLQGKSPDEIDMFHQHTVQRLAVVSSSV